MQIITSELFFSDGGGGWAGPPPSAGAVGFNCTENNTHQRVLFM